MERIGNEFPVLIGQTGPLNGQRWVIGQSMVIGRDTGCDLVIPDRQVSRYHLRLTIQEDGVLVEDLGSKNGTYHNGHLLVEPVFLQDGDVLQVAVVQSLVYLSSDATMPMDAGQEGIVPYRGKLYLDKASRRVWVGEEEVVPPLSAPQFRLLELLYDQQGKVVSRQDLISTVWGDSEALGVTEQAFDALVRRLRDRLNALDTEHPYLVTVRGHGLRLDNPIK